MDKAAEYRRIIKNILSQYAELVSRQPEAGMETQLIFDEERDQYLWVQAGWSSQHRVHGVTLHIRLHEGKILVEQDWTEDGVATDLLTAGVPDEDIVLSFHEPETRRLKEFSAA